MINIKQKISTFISIYRIIKFIKQSKKNSYIIGYEMASIYSFLYNKYKHTYDNITLYNSNIYNILLTYSNYRNFEISKFLKKNNDFSKLFSMLNIKILELDYRYLWSYLRGYYINELDIYNINLFNEKKEFWFILYDFHLHYLLFIYNFMNKDYKNIGNINFLLNNQYDNYSINDITDNLNYKMVFIHNSNKINNSIANILNMFYSEITSESELYNEEDITLYRNYISYINN